MRAPFVAIVVCSLVLVACSGDDDAAAPSSPSTTTTDVATTTTAAGPPPTVASNPGRRTFLVRETQLRKGESLDIALHPDSPMQLTTTTTNLEVCPAAVNGGIDLSGGSWPGDVFDQCLPFVDGHATVPAPPVHSFHIGFGVRDREGGATTIDELAVDYVGVDQFCQVMFPQRDANETSPEIVVTPTRSTTVVAGVEASPAPVSVEQRSRPLPAYAPTSAVRGTTYGPARLGAPVTITLTTGPPIDQTALLVEWS
jgi:hypothetical protein